MKLQMDDEELTTLVTSSWDSTYGMGIQNGKQALRPSGLLRNDLFSPTVLPREHKDMASTAQMLCGIHLLAATHDEPGRMEMVVTTMFLQAYNQSLFHNGEVLLPSLVREKGLRDPKSEEAVITAEQVSTICEAIAGHCLVREMQIEPSTLPMAYVAGLRFYQSVEDSQALAEILALGDTDG